MLKDGFLRFCDDPELTCCKAEAELGRLRNENARLLFQLQDAQRRVDAAVECVEEVEYSLASSHFSAAWAAIREWRGIQENGDDAE